MKKTKEIAVKVQQKNNSLKNKIEKKKGTIKYKVGDPNRLFFYW